MTPLAIRLALVLAASAATAMAAPVQAQEAPWRPPTREMPSMPSSGELSADWLTPRAAWFRGVEAAAGVPLSSLRASGDARPGSGQVQLARFSSGPLPVVVWTDRNGDGRCDLIDLYRRGGVILQLVDADYDGSANVLRVYDADGALIRQERL